jgi:hypothetical protein
MKLGNLMAENQGLDVDKGSHPGVLTLTDDFDIQQGPSDLQPMESP